MPVQLPLHGICLMVMVSLCSSLPHRVVVPLWHAPQTISGHQGTVLAAAAGSAPSPRQCPESKGSQGCSCDGAGAWSSAGVKLFPTPPDVQPCGTALASLQPGGGRSSCHSLYERSGIGYWMVAGSGEPLGGLRGLAEGPALHLEDGVHAKASL